MGTVVKEKVAVAAMIACVAFATSGCKNLLKRRTGSDAGATSSVTPATAQDIADEQLQEKLDEFIKCLNSLSSPIHQARHRYLTYVPKAGPTGREQNADIYKLPPNAATSCSTGIAKAKTMPPANAKLEAAGTEFSAAASEVDHLISDIDNYLEMRSFRDDKWAKGKAMHPRLMAAWTRFAKADKEMHDTLDGITKPLAQRILARIEREEGKKFRYSRKKTLIAARELIEASDPIGDDDDIDFNLYSAAYTDFEKGLDELIAYGATHKPELGQTHGPNWPMAESNFDQFVREATDFKKAAKEFWRCLRDAPTKAKTPSGKIDLQKMGNCADGPAWRQEEETIKQYNEFIRTSNNHQFP